MFRNVTWLPGFTDTVFGEAPLDVGSWLVHSYQQIVTERIDGRMLTVVADREEALIAQEYLHHDLVLQRAQLAIGFDEWDRWWQADPDLRTIILASQPEEVPK